MFDVHLLSLLTRLLDPLNPLINHGNFDTSSLRHLHGLLVASLLQLALQMQRLVHVDALVGDGVPHRAARRSLDDARRPARRVARLLEAQAARERIWQHVLRVEMWLGGKVGRGTFLCKM